MWPCAILCGGLATRLGPITETLPKSLVPINGIPFIAHQLELLRRSGIDRVVLCTGHLGGMIEDFVGNGSNFGLQVTYSFDGPELLGTAGALRKALPLLGDTFFVLYGDSYLPCDYLSIAESFERSRARALMTIYRNQGKFDTSNVEWSGDRIVRYAKRNRTPAMQHIDYGLGIFRASVFQSIVQPRTTANKRPVRCLPALTACDLMEVYQGLIEAGELAAYEVAERFYEIGSVQGIRDLEGYLAESPRTGTRD